MDKNTCGIFLGTKLNIGGSKWAHPSLGPISFIFMEFLAKLSRITGWCPLLWGWHTHIWQILDLLLLKNFFLLQWLTYTENCWLPPSLLQDCKISCDLLGKFLAKNRFVPNSKRFGVSVICTWFVKGHRWYIFIEQSNNPQNGMTKKNL